MEHLTFDELLMYAKRTIKLMRDENGKIKQEYRELTTKVNNHINTCPDCRKMLIKLQEANSMEEIEKLRAEFEHKKLEALTEEEIISKKYGISVDSIEHIRLPDGKEYYHFYDIKLNKDIILKQNQDNKNMSEELKEVQEGLSNAQSTNEQVNGEEAFRYQRLHTNNEVKLYSVEELMSNPELLGNINREQMKAVSVLLKNKDVLKIKEIDPETGIAIDDTHTVITSYYNEQTQKYEVSLPKQYQYTTDVVSMSETEQMSQDNIEVGNFSETNETVEVTNDIPTEIDGVLIDPERFKLYYEYPELLDRQEIVSPEEKAAYMKAIEHYQKSLENKQEQSKDKPKVLVYKNENSASEEERKQAGFINLLLLSLTTGFAGGVITAIMLGIIR